MRRLACAFGKLSADAVVLNQRLTALYVWPIRPPAVQRDGGTEHRCAGIGIRLRKERGQHVETVADFTHDVLIRYEAVGKPFAHLVVHAANGKPGRSRSIRKQVQPSAIGFPFSVWTKSR